jgi:6-pyruvoyl-tetrahydropterin synthase related domain
MTARAREAVVDAIGLAVLAFVLLDYLRPELLFLATVPAGGDTPGHYPTFLYLRDQLLPQLRLHGWYPDAFLGSPVLLYYFPLPFLLMSALSLALPAPVAFKLGTVGGVVLLPLAAYLSFRMMRFRAPGPLLAAAGAVVFLFLEDNVIWGGTLASTLAGEFAYAYGLAFAVLFLGVAYRAYSQDRAVWMPAVALALAALSHGYAAVWAGLAATYFLYMARKPWRTIAWLSGVAAIGLALGAFALVPMIAGWRWTTPYADPWIEVTVRGLCPPFLLPLLIPAVAGVIATVLGARRSGGADHRLLYLAHAAVVALALAVAGPTLGLTGIRFVPLAHAVLAMTGGAVLGGWIGRLRAPDPAALACVIAAAVYADARSSTLRDWANWDLTGLAAKPQWSKMASLAERLSGTVADPRVVVEHGRAHEEAGSLQAYQMLPLLSGRAVVDGLYHQASLSSEAVYYAASELDAQPLNPFRNRAYATFDTDAAIAHLRLMNARDVVAVSPKLISALLARRDATLVARLPPFALFRLDGDWRYVTPLTHAPIRESPRGWRETAYRWLARRPLSPAPLVFTDDPSFERASGAGAPEVPLPAGVTVEETVEAEQITITTSRVGHPLLVKVSYHPRWRVEGARGPFLVAPSLMMIVPERPTVRLYYEARAVSDWLGLGLTATALLLAAAWPWRRRLVPRAPSAPVDIEALECEFASAPPRWGGLIPAAIIISLLLSRLIFRTGP